MAFENLIIIQSSEIAGIKIDGTLTETTSETMITSSNPLENGVIITDHVVQQPRSFSMEGVISDTPLIGAGFGGSLAYTLGGVINRISGDIGSSLPSGASRSKQAYLQLRALMLKRDVIKIKTNLGDVENLIFTSLSVSQDKDTARAVFFTATFIEILIVTANVAGVNSNTITDNEVSAAYGTSKNGGVASPTQTSSNQENNLLRASAGGLTPK